MELGALTISIWLTALQVDFSSEHLASDTLLQIQGKFVDEPYMIIVADAADIVCEAKKSCGAITSNYLEVLQ